MNSICIATYNGEKYIAEQLQSILTQIDKDDEVIISDDNSTDRTIDIIHSFNDKRIVLLHASFHNFNLNFENALLHARGEYIFISDQDDIWLPEKYSNCIKELQFCDLICTNATLIDEDKNTINASFFDYYKSGPGILKNTIKCTYCGACMAFNRSILHKAIPLPKNIYFGYDLWIGIVAEVAGTVHFIDTPYILYRRHADTKTSISNQILLRSKRPFHIKTLSRIQLLYHASCLKIRQLTKHYL